MKRLNLLAFILVLLTSLTSCDKGTNELKRARSVGGTSEILFVTQNDEQWNGQMGQTVRDFFEQEQYGLPQPEKNFRVSHINTDALNDTSKISQAADLFQLRTMGFRGEALASICAVAHVEVNTRRPEDEVGTHLEIAGSKVITQDVTQ